MTERSRSLPQGAKFHALCDEVARQATFGGRKLSGKQWKVLFCSGLAMVEGKDPDLAIGLEGEFVMLRESTARMSVERMNQLIEYSTSWALLNGIKLSK